MLFWYFQNNPTKLLLKFEGLKVRARKAFNLRVLNPKTTKTFPCWFSNHQPVHYHLVTGISLCGTTGDEFLCLSGCGSQVSPSQHARFWVIRLFNSPERKSNSTKIASKLSISLTRTNCHFSVVEVSARLHKQVSPWQVLFARADGKNGKFFFDRSPCWKAGMLAFQQGVKENLGIFPHPHEQI